MFQYLVVRTDTKLVQQLDDNHYNSKDLVEIKIPLNSPYITNTKGYERYDGSIELKGVQYNFVKRKIYNDTLYLVCIYNEKKMELTNAKNNFQKLVTDIPSNKKNNESNIKKLSSTDEYNFPLESALTNSAIISKQEKLFFSTALSTRFIQSKDQPPEISC